MVNVKKYLFLIPLTFITIHAFFMNGYKYVYQYLTVGTYLDPIVAKADPSLFKYSLYVNAVNRTQVRMSIIYDLYPSIVKHFDFEVFALAQHIVILFFILSGIFALTRVLWGSSIAGYVAMLLYTAALNNWTVGSPSPYPNFFHHSLPYTYPFMVWSMVFFFQKRYPLALMVTGISWNFHPMCTVFLLFVYFIYWLFNRSEFNLKTLLACFAAFIIPAFPTLIKSSIYLSKGMPYDQIWLTVAHWTAWFVCFPSTWSLSSIIHAGLFLLLFIISLLTLPDNKIRKGVLTFILAVGIMCLLGTLFADLYPIPFAIKLSLWRSTIIYLFLALPCIAYLLMTMFNCGNLLRFPAINIMILLTGYLQGFKLYYLPVFICFLLIFLYENRLVIRFPFLHGRFSLLFIASLFAVFTYQALFDQESMRLLIFFIFTMIFLLCWRLLELYRRNVLTNFYLLTVLFIVLFDLGVLYQKGGPAIYFHGRIQGKVDPWADIQIFAHKHSDKDDLFIIPPYLNDFGIYSLRATLGDWAEGSNGIYLDQQFNHDWYNRMGDIGWKKLYGAEEGYNKLTTEEIQKAAKKYGVKFVVTEKPKTFALQKIYENDKFILYEIL
jgi:hypothetical protein